MKALFLLLALAGVCAAAPPDVYINLAGRSGQSRALPLGLPPFAAEDPQRGADALMGKRLRDVIRANADHIRYVTFSDDSVLRDIDTPEDYQKITHHSAAADNS